MLAVLLQGGFEGRKTRLGSGGTLFELMHASPCMREARFPEMADGILAVNVVLTAIQLSPCDILLRCLLCPIPRLISCSGQGLDPSEQEADDRQRQSDVGPDFTVRRAVLPQFRCRLQLGFDGGDLAGVSLIGRSLRLEPAEVVSSESDVGGSFLDRAASSSLLGLGLGTLTEGGSN